MATMSMRSLCLVPLFLVGACVLSTHGTDTDNGQAGAGVASGGSGAGTAADGGSDAGAGGAGVGGGTGSAGGAGSGGGAPDGWWDPAFTRRMKISFDNDGGEALPHFPVMIHLTPERIDYDLSPDGADLRFVDADGQSVLDHEIEHWAPGGDSFVWVRVPEIAASDGDFIWLYHGNPGAADAQQPAGVWTEGGHLGVYHLSTGPDQESQFRDSAGPHHGAPAGGPPGEQQGIVATATTLSGTRHIDMGDDIPAFAASPGQRRTIEAWFRTSASTDAQFVVYQESGCKGWGIAVLSSGAVQGRFSSGGTTGDACVNDNYDEYLVETDDDDYSDGAWHHVALVVDRPGETLSVYVDGALRSDGGIDNTGVGTSIENKIGTDWDNDGAFQGSIDEVRISDGARSPAWIDAQHRSMRDVFATYGQVEQL